MWPAKIQISLYIHPVWQGFLFIPLWIARRWKKTHWISEDRSDCADVQADLSRHSSHKSYCRFVVCWPKCQCVLVKKSYLELWTKNFFPVVYVLVSRLAVSESGCLDCVPSFWNFWRIGPADTGFFEGRLLKQVQVGAFFSSVLTEASEIHAS